MNEQELVKKLKGKKDKDPPIRTKDLLSTGVTALNLACTGRVKGGYPKGSYIFYVGDSTSGKTWVTMAALAEACLNKRFEDYRLIFDKADNGALMDVEHFFGKLARRLEPPAWDGEEPLYSRTAEEFYFNLHDALKKGPCIYVLDDMDTLDTKEDDAKFEERKKAYRKRKAGKETKEPTGSYGTSKAKINSTFLRKMVNLLRKTGSILIIISQTRDNIGGFFTMEKKTRAGGHALKFFATLEIWTSVKQRIKKKIKDKNRQLGIMVQAKVKKNRITGRETTITFPIYYSFGIDDIGNCVDYLLEEGHWKKDKGGIKATEFDFIGSKDQLVHKVEQEDLQADLQSIVGQVWKEIEEACRLRRKSRYHTEEDDAEVTEGESV